MSVALDRKTVVEVYCCCRQAERSLHRACDPANPWSSLQGYYDVHKQDGLRRLQAKLKDRLPAAQGAAQVIARNQLHAAPSLWRTLCGSVLARWQTAWRFSEQEIQFIAAALGNVLDLLAKTEVPEGEILQSRRRDLVDCQGIIEVRCVGLPELKRAQGIAHFDQRPDSATVEISDLVSDAA
jgi:hypothetical protein